MKEKMETLLKSNFELEHGSFLYGLRNESEFYLPAFNEFVFSVAQSNQLSLSIQERNLLSNSLWELLFLILKSLYHDARKDDIYYVKGISEEKKLILVNNLYYLGNHFSYGKTIELNEALL